MEHSLSGENFEDVMIFTNSIKDIMAYFLKFKDDVVVPENTNTDNNFAGMLVDILTFNMLRSGAAKNQEPKTRQLQFVQF